MTAERIQLEGRVREILAAVEAHQQIEDGLVELKSSWPEPAQAARRIAAHANAAHGADILWLIGVDEKAGTMPGAPRREVATWWQQVAKHFDDVAPGVTDLTVPHEGVSVVALVFDTSTGPFVIKTGDERYSREVPWREGTRVRSAQRSDLFRMLAPLVTLPKFEEGTARLILSERGGSDVPRSDRWRWDFRAQAYVVPASDQPVVFPFHKLQVECRVGTGSRSPRIAFAEPRLGPPQSVSSVRGSTFGLESESLSLTVHATGTEVIVNGPGMLVVTGWVATAPSRRRVQEEVALARITLQPAGSDLAAQIRFELPPKAPSANEFARWEVPGRTVGVAW